MFNLKKRLFSTFFKETRWAPAGIGHSPTLRLSSSLSDGDNARDAKQWPKAIVHYAAHLDLHPDDVNIVVQLGNVLKEDGQYNSALNAYKKALVAMPDDADLCLQLGHLAKMMNDWPEMLAQYARAFQLDPALEDPYRELMAYLPRTVGDWIALRDRRRASEAVHDFPAVSEPRVRLPAPSVRVVDPAVIALRTSRIARAVRPPGTAAVSSAVERGYAETRLSIFNSSYGDPANILPVLAGLSGVLPDQPLDAACTVAFGAVPASQIKLDLPIQPHPLLANYQRMQVAASERLILRPELKGRSKTGPRISVLLPIYRGPLIFVERAILSVLLQTHDDLQLCIVDDFSDRWDISALLAFYAASDPRVTLRVHERNGGIAAATNTALAAATGTYVALLDHDDMLAHDALEIIAARLAERPAIDLIYTDECKIDGNDVASEVFAKPDWSPSLLSSVMYTAHLSVYRTSLVHAVAGFRTEFDFSQDYDLALRATEAAQVIVHVREFLYGWRAIAGSAAQGDKPMARLTNVAALQSAAARRHLDGLAIGLPMSNRLRRERPIRPPKVSMIIPSDNEAHIAATIASLRLVTAYPDFEIIVVTNTQCATACQRQAAFSGIRFAVYDKAYNFSDKCNVGAQAAAGDYLVFVNDDVRATDPEWLDVVLETLSLPGVGIVGPKLLYENGSIQHGGMVTGVRRLVGTAFHAYPDVTPAHFGFAQGTREVSLICGACLAIRADVFARVGGFDGVNTPIAHSDVDLCFRVREAGLTCVYTGHTKLTHIGHVSIGSEKRQKQKPVRKDKSDIFLLRRWKHYCKDDPYFTDAMRDILFLDSQAPFQLHASPLPVNVTGKDVLIVSHDLSGSGAPKIVFDIAETLLAQGHYVLVVSPEGGPFLDRLLAIGADVLIDALCLSGSDDGFFGLARQFDAVIANTVVTWPVINQLANETRLFWYVHETELVGNLSRQHPELGREAALAMVWAGSRMAAEALQAIGITAEVIEYGVEPAVIVNRPKARRIVISVMATYEPRKGQDLALVAYQALAPSLRAVAELRFAGRVNDQAFYEGLIQLDSDRVVTHLGTLSLEQYRLKLSETDIVLCPSRDDTLPLVSLDALANGKVLICSRATGTSEYIADGVSGYIPATSNPTDIAVALGQAIRDQAKWPRIAQAAKQVFAANFTIDRFRSRVLQATSLNAP